MNWSQYNSLYVQQNLHVHKNSQVWITVTNNTNIWKPSTASEDCEKNDLIQNIKPVVR